MGSHVLCSLKNRLLARGPRFRLPAELIRDQALAVSGLLVEKIGGPSVRPYMPEGVWDEKQAHQAIEHPSHQVAIDRLAESLCSGSFSRPDRDVASRLRHRQRARGGTLRLLG